MARVEVAAANIQTRFFRLFAPIAPRTARKQTYVRLMDRFEEWSLQNVFTGNYYPHEISCHFCMIPRSNVHMCLYNSGEIIKMQRCPDKDDKVYNNENLIPPLDFLIKFKNYVCPSCFIYCYPDRKFVRKCKEAIELVAKSMQKFDMNFIAFFKDKLKKFLFTDILSCVSCSQNLYDYKWRTYKQWYKMYTPRA